MPTNITYLEKNCASEVHRKLCKHCQGELISPPSVTLQSQEVGRLGLGLAYCATTLRSACLYNTIFSFVK